MLRARLAALALTAIALLLLGGPAAFAQGTEQGFQGTISDAQGEPVPGVTITVLDGEQEVAEGTSGQDGSWSVSVPEPGDYDVELDVSTLPDDLEPRAPGDERLENVSLTPGQTRTVLFPLAPPGQGGPDQPSQVTPSPGSDTTGGSGTDGFDLGGFSQQVAQLTLEGIKYGLIIAMTAIGLSLIFGTTQLINFAHGELVTIGAVVAFFLNVTLGVPLVLAALVAIVVGIAVGAGNERLVWRPLRRRGTARIQLFIISIGLSLFLRHLILWIYGSSPRPYAQYTLQQSMEFGPISITPRDLTIMVLSIVVLLGVGLMLQRTRIGKAMRAVADNRDLAEASGIAVDRVVLVVWMLGGGLAALGGVLFGLAEIVAWDMGFRLLLLMFAGVILGGLGTAYGAVVGSLVVGLVAQLSTLWFPSELQNAWAMLVLILTLMVRPQGIFGRRERIG